MSNRQKKDTGEKAIYSRIDSRLQRSKKAVVKFTQTELKCANVQEKLLVSPV